MSVKHRNIWAFTLVAFICMGALSASHPVSLALAQTDERLLQLPTDQKRLAHRMLRDHFITHQGFDAVHDLAEPGNQGQAKAETNWK